MDHQLPHVSLREEDWDFSGCTKDEIFDCWVYEFAREYFRRHKTVLEACHMFFPVSDGFPGTPYLCTSRVNPSEEDVKLVSEWLDKHPEVRPKPPLSEVREEDHPDFRLKIDWRFSDTVLLRWMKRILNEKRPSPPVQRKGRQEFGVLETDLKCLGAFRLLKIGKLSISQATDYTQSELGDALYSEQADWTRACARVDGVINNFSDSMSKYNQENPL